MNKNIFKQIRIDAGISQSDYADALGLSQTFVSLMENGKYPISDSTKRKVVRGFNVSDEIMNQLDRLRNLETTEKGIDYDKVDRIRKMFDKAIATKLTIYADMGEFNSSSNTKNIPNNILELIENEITSKIGASLYSVIGSAIEEYEELIKEATSTN